MKYDLPPELSGTAARSLPSLASYVQAVKGDLPAWLSRSVTAALDSLDRARLTAGTAAEQAAIGEVWTHLRTHRAACLQRLAHALAEALDQDGAVAATPPQADPVDELNLSLTLSLLDEDTIDEDIALSRLVRAAEGGSETALRDLAARCSSMRGLPSVSPDANPMRPVVVAGALRQAVAGLGLPPAQRVLLLRELGAAIGGHLGEVYQGQCKLLAGWGVEPSPFGARLTLSEPRAITVAGVRAETPTLQQELPLAQVAAEALRRLGVDGTVEAGGSAAEVMAQLLSVLLSRATLSEDSRALIQRLDGPACRIAVEEPQVWQSPDHPLWHLLDRLVSAATVHDTLQAPGPGGGAGADTVGATLERVVRELETSSSPGSAHCQSALTAVDFAVSDLLGEQAARVAPQAQALQQRQSCAAMELRMREQIEQQVQGSDAPPVLRRFLVGPWALALAHSASTHGVDSRQVRGQAELVDALIAACSRPPGGRLSWTLFTRCVTHARLGLEDAGYDAARVQVELADLEHVLREPWTAREAAAADGPALVEAPANRPEAPAEVLSSFAETVPSALSAPFDPTARLGLHDALPTVPIDMDDAAGASASGGGSDRAAAWLLGLEPGQVCRLFLLQRWMNAHLVWRSANHSMFIFNSRHGGRTHSLSRRSLEKLRAAGLATTIERGEFVARAMRELAGRSRAAQPG